MKAVCSLTGLTPDTLRAWERRYQAVTPQREANGRRSYGPAEVERLRLLSLAVKAGHAIRKVATLTDEELRGRVDTWKKAKPDGEGEEALRGRLLQAVEEFDADACERLVATALAVYPVASVARSVLSPVLQEVGRRWETGEFSVAQERLLSSTLDRALMALMSALRQWNTGPELVLATLPGERHEFGLMMAALAASGVGVRSNYLGVDLPAEELARLVESRGARAVGLSIVLSPPVPEQAHELARLREFLAEDTEILVGGPGATDLRSQGRIPPGVRYVRDHDDLQDALRSILT